MEERGINTSAEEIAVIIAAMELWMTTTPTGKEYIVDMCGFDWAYGESESKYIIRDQYGRVKEVSHDQIMFLQTCVAAGNFVNPTLVSSKKIEKVGCDSCGVLSHCTRPIVQDNGGTKDYCNHCLQYVEDPNARDKGGGIEECKKCSALLCEYHPARDERRMA